MSGIHASGRNEIVANENFVVFDPTGHARRALPWNVPKATYRTGLCEIENDSVWTRRLGRTPFRVPEVRGLTTDGVFRRTVLAFALFAVDIGDCPTFGAQRISALI